MIGDITDSDLYSPGRSIAKRQALETALLSVVWRATRAVLRAMRSYVSERVAVPQPSEVRALWIASVDNFMERSGIGEEARAELTPQLHLSDTPDEIRQTAVDILVAVAQQGDPDLLDELLDIALSDAPPESLVAAGWDDVLSPPGGRTSAIDALLELPNAPPSVPIEPPSWLPEPGDKWGIRAARNARTWATTFHGSISLKRMRARGLKRKLWVTRGDDKVRRSHADVGGSLIPLESAFYVGGYPMMFPGDPSAPYSQTVNCFPGDTLVASGNILGATRRWYMGELVEVETQREKLRVTLNHPILTDFGWCLAGDLVEGDDLLSYLGGVETPVPHHIDAQPTPISEVFDTLAVAGDSVRVGAGGVNFHGERPQGDVDVVSTHRELGNGAETEADKFIRELLLPSPDPSPAALEGDSLTGHLEVTGPTTPSGDVRGSRILDALSGSSRSGQESVRLGSSSRHNAMPSEHPSEGRSADTRLLSERVLGLPGEVSPDKVISVRRVEWSGHVYNLSTGTGAFTANGIIVHNCRCVLTGARGGRYG